MPDTQQLHADMDAARLRLESEVAAAVREVAAASARLTLAHERLARHEMQVEMTVRAMRAEEAIFNAD